MKRKMILKRMFVLVSSLAMFVSLFCGNSMFFYAYNSNLVWPNDTTEYNYLLTTVDPYLKLEDDCYVLPKDIDDYEYFMLRKLGGGSYSLALSNEPFTVHVEYSYYDSKKGHRLRPHNLDTDGVVFLSSSDGTNWNSGEPVADCFGLYWVGDGSETPYDSAYYMDGSLAWTFISYGYPIECSSNILGTDGKIIWNAYAPSVGVGDEIVPDSSPIGFLRKLNLYTIYKRGKLYNYNENSQVDKWTYSDTLSNGNSLKEGDYSINFYVRPVMVAGYDDGDIVEKGEKYCIGTYDAKEGFIKYAYSDLEDKLKELGYDGIGFIDKYLLGRFVLKWYYFEVVDNTTGASDGFVRARPKEMVNHGYWDMNGGVDFELVAVDEFDNIITDYETDVGYHGMGDYIPGEETELDAFDEAEQDIEEQINEVDIDGLVGIDSFVNSLNGITLEIGNVPTVISGFFGCLPDWVGVVLGLSVAFSFVIFVIKVLRG